MTRWRGHCDHWSCASSGNKIRVADNGRGIPVDVHKQTKFQFETIMTTLHAGGKLAEKIQDTKFPEVFMVSVLLSVNALSVLWKLKFHRDGGIYPRVHTRKSKIKSKEVAKSKSLWNDYYVWARYWNLKKLKFDWIESFTTIANKRIL